MLNKLYLILVASILIISCATNKKEVADLLVYNGNIYTVDSTFSKAEAFAVRDGKFLEIGSLEGLKNKYDFNDKIDVEGKTIVPGLIDAHAHFYRMGLQKQTVDLMGTKSFDEVLERIVAFQKDKKSEYITGRGWDQNDWDIKEFPNKHKLDSLFPDTPVAITRVDGHALLANQAALEMARVTINSKADGGAIEVENGELTGILIDNPMSYVYNSMKEPSTKEMIAALIEAQKICFAYGLTTVVDAGINKNTIDLIDSLNTAGELKIRLYAMISNTPQNLDYYLGKEPYKTDLLNVRSIKFYGDGALGSRGAALKEPYSDKANHYGALLSSVADFNKTAERIANSKYQMNTHAIGDSANRMVLQTYDALLKDKGDRRWRIEHSQVIDSADFKYFSKNIIPSVQPTHATSDMYWAEERLGPKRIEGAYAFKKLLDQAGIVALGTDFPVEDVNPYYTFYAAVSRKDLQNYPEGGYMMEQALSREETLKGMTIWAAYANFEEEEKGSIETGKFADFAILDQNIMEIEESEIPKMKVKATYVNGEKVF